MLEFKKTSFFKWLAVNLHMSRSDNAVNITAGWNNYLVFLHTAEMWQHLTCSKCHWCLYVSGKAICLFVCQQVTLLLPSKKVAFPQVTTLSSSGDATWAEGWTLCCNMLTKNCLQVVLWFLLCRRKQWEKVSPRPSAEMGLLRTVFPLGVIGSLGVFVLLSHAQS